jgi:putative AdoMet-dependent methyltransferase
MPEDWKTWDFDQWADSYDGWVTSDDPVYARYDEVLDLVVRLAKAARGALVLDVGTGTGNLALRLAAVGAQVVGLDPSSRMLALAHEKLGECTKIELRQVDQPFLAIPYPDDHFDAVVSSYAFHHVPRPRQHDGIREMVRVLEPGGVWVLGDLIFANEYAERATLDRCDWMEDEYYPRIEELRPTFTKLGMDLDSKQFTPVTWVLWGVKPL